MEDIINNQLLNLFKSMFNKESLRRNVYLFNALNQNMELSIKTILKERRIAQITSDPQRIINVLTKCPNVILVSNQLIRLQIPGDQLIVKINSNQSQKLTKKEIMQFTKQMKCEAKQDKSGVILEFQSFAAVSEFLERIKQSGNSYSYQIVQKNPYLSLQESINRIRKQKKANSHQPQTPINYVHADYNFTPNNYIYPIFIRKAVDSDEEQFSKPILKMQEKQKVSYHMNEFDFPSVEQK